MQRLLLNVLFIFASMAGKVLAQSGKQATADPAWLPKETVKTDTASKTRQTGIKALISGLDPVMNASASGGKGKSASLSSLFGETIPDLGLRVKEYKSQKAERKRKKARAKLAKVQYEGIPMQSTSIKYGSGDRATVESFHVLTEYKPINPYTLPANTRWYDLKTKRLSSGLIKTKELARPLHGPYRKFSGENLIEEGFYYMGIKDGRWVTYDNQYNLINKSIWDKGFPAESRITYYDSAHLLVKEVLPIEFGVVEGDFLEYYKEGQLMASGKYQNGVKIGRWVEYQQFRRQRKRELQYPKTCWDEEFEPFILREWDEKGKLVYDSSTDPRASIEEEHEEK